MTKKRTLLVLLVVAGLGGVAAYAYSTTPEPGPTMKNFDRYIREGMSLRQVDAVLGTDYEVVDPPRHDCGHGYRWIGSDVTIEIHFYDHDGAAFAGGALSHDWEDRRFGLEQFESLLDTVKSLLGL